jgi:hypothetical protein
MSTHAQEWQILFPDDEGWTPVNAEAEITADHTDEPTYTIEDVTLGDKLLHCGTWFEVRGFRVHPEAGISVLLDGKWTEFKDGTIVQIEEAP